MPIGKKFGTNEVKQFIETNGVELVLENDLKYFELNCNNNKIK